MYFSDSIPSIFLQKTANPYRDQRLMRQFTKTQNIASSILVHSCKLLGNKEQYQPSHMTSIFLSWLCIHCILHDCLFVGVHIW